MMPRKPVVGVVYGHLFTFLPPTRAFLLLEQTAIDGRPKPMPSPLNYPANLDNSSAIVNIVGGFDGISKRPILIGLKK